MTHPQKCVQNFWQNSIVYNVALLTKPFLLFLSGNILFLKYQKETKEVWFNNDSAKHNARLIDGIIFNLGNEYLSNNKNVIVVCVKTNYHYSWLMKALACLASVKTNCL